MGWVAPLLLCILRFGQGFGLGGEWGGAALLAVEAPPGAGNRALAPRQQLGAPVGFLAANGLFLVLGLCLTEADFAAWGWRVPFLASAVLVVIGLWVRLRIGETAAFQEALAHEPPPAVPLARLLSHHVGGVLAGGAGVIACFAISTSPPPSRWRGHRHVGLFARDVPSVQLAANSFLAVGIVLAAIQSDRTSPRRVLLLGAGRGRLGLVSARG